MKWDTKEFFRECAPVVKKFAGYAELIQPVVDIRSKSSRDEDPAIASVTDADFMIENGLLKFLLDRGYGPKISIGTEEGSPYAHKFSDNSPIRVEIDPIDGTLAYEKKINTWCVVLSVLRKGILDGTLVYTATDHTFYCATRDREKSWTWKLSDMGEFAEQDFVLRPRKGSERILLTHLLPRETQRALEDKGFEVNQAQLAGKEGGYPFRVGLNHIYRGEIGAYFKKFPPARDWGAISLIVEKAGGEVTYYDGSAKDIHQYFGRGDKTEEGCIPSIICAANSQIHKELVDILKK